jgi:hypothetical protein
MNTNVHHSLRSSSHRNSVSRIALIQQLMNTELRQKIAKNFSKKILSVCQGCEFRVTSENRAFVTSLANEFENEELIVLCLDVIGEALTPESVVESLCLKISHGIGAEMELDFIATYFHKLGFDLLDRFNCDALSVILSRDSLVVSLEDSFFQLIATWLANSSEFFRLFEFVAFGCLSRNSLQAFVELSFAQFTPGICRTSYGAFVELSRNSNRFNVYSKRQLVNSFSGWMM